MPDTNVRHDPRALKIAPTIPTVLDRHQLVATYTEEDDSCDAAIEVRLAGAGEDDDLGDIQITTYGTYVANVWTDARQEARAHGCERIDPNHAITDLVGMLEKYNRIAAQ